MIPLNETFTKAALDVLESQLAVLRAEAVLASKKQNLDRAMGKLIDSGMNFKNSGTPP
jgi:hypothetical protein